MSRSDSSPLSSSGTPVPGPPPRIGRRLTVLRDEVRATARNEPGVYRMLGGEGETLYIGRSVRLRTRLLSYFRAAPDEKGAQLLRETFRIRWDPLPTEFSTLIAELRAIRGTQPRFNVQHRGRRRYVFARITEEPAPRLITTAGRGGGTLFGPFAHPRQTAETLRELTLVLGLRDCGTRTPMHFRDQLDLGLDAGVRRENEPPGGCLRVQLKSCTAPCIGGCSAAEYGERIALARDFLEGGGDALAEALRRRMHAAADRKDFEYARILRDRAERFERMRADLLAFRGRVRQLTFLYPARSPEGRSWYYPIVAGRVLGEIPSPTGRDRERTLVRKVRELLAQASLPSPDRLDATDVAEILEVSRWFRLRPEELAQTQPLPVPAESGSSPTAPARPPRPSAAPPPTPPR